MVREVSEFEKVKALVHKDLTIRVERTKKSFLLCALVTIGVCWAIPLVYFCVDPWIWEIKDHKSIRTFGDYDLDYWFDDAFPHQDFDDKGIAIRVQPEDMELARNGFDKCNNRNGWIMNRYNPYNESYKTGDVYVDYREVGTEDSKGFEPWYLKEGKLQVTASIDYPQKSLSVWGGTLFSTYEHFTIIPGFQMEFLLKCLYGAGAEDSGEYDMIPGPYIYYDDTGKELFNFDDGEDARKWFYDEYEGDWSDDWRYVFANWINEQQWPRHKNKYIQYEMIQWDELGWYRHYTSVAWTLIPGFLWLFIFFMITSGYLMHITNERNSGIKVIMMSMGLSSSTYMTSQFVSYMLELSVTMLPASIGIAAMVSDATGNSGMGFYVWMSLMISFMNTAPFLFCLAAFLQNEKQANALNNVFKFILPLTPAMVLIQTLNIESGATRFFVCMIPPLNFMISVRDAIKDDITPEPILAWFFNFIFWVLIAYYFDNTMPSSADSGGKRHCWFYYDWQNEKIAQGASTELTSNQEAQEHENALLVVQDLRKQFGHFQAVNGMNLTIKKNTIYGLLGFNGAGKTTTINMITGILQPTSGNVWIDGVDISKNISQVRAYLGLCPQHNVLYDMLTVEQHMYLFGRLRGMTDAQTDEQMGPLLKQLHMESQRGTFASNLSGGQKRMLCLVQAFLGDPKLVLLDEPTSGVDAESRRVMWDFIKSKKEGRVIILTTHQMREADVLCDIIGIMSAGKLLVEDTAVDLKNAYSVGFTFFVDGDQDEITQLCEMTNGFEANIELEQDLCKITVHDKYRNEIPEWLEDLEQLPSVKERGCKINCQAATLESVFLNLAKNVEDAQRVVSLRESVRSSFLSSGTEGGYTHVTEPKPRKVKKAKKKKRQSSRSSTRRLEGLNTEVALYSRPNPCTQLFYLTLKRLFLNLTYWSPLFVALCQVIVLAVLVNFLLTLLGSTGASRTLKVHDPSSMYVWDDTLYSAVEDDPYYVQYFQDVDSVTPHPSTDWQKAAGWQTRTKPEEPYILVHRLKDSLGEPATTIYMEPYWFGQMFAFVQFIGTDTAEDTTALAGSAGNGLTSILASLVAVLGIGLIISSTWHYIGKEIKENLFEYQVQNGVNPFMLWFSHWVFDVGLNTLMMSIFVAICWSGSGADYTTNGVIWSGFCAFLPYVILQYIVIWTLKVDRVIEAVLTWSTYMCIGIWFGFFYWCSIDDDGNAWDGDLIWDYLGKDASAWEQNGKFKIALMVNYLLPPNQFMQGIVAAVSLEVFKDDPAMFDAWDKEFYNTRFWKSLGAAVFWALVFFGIQLYEINKPDPMPPVSNKELPEDVRRENAAVQSIVAEHFSEHGGAAVPRASTRSNSTRGSINTAPLLGDTEAGGIEYEIPGIIADGITKVYTKNSGPFTACDNLHFHVDKGECFGLLGKNGAGKSTTMNMLTTLQTPSSGRGFLSGRSSIAQKRAILGYCPQKDLFWEKLTVYQHLLYYGLLKGVPPSDINETIERLCVGLTLDPYYNACTGTLSGGNKRKVMLATALIGSVEVLFLDECSTGVDPFARKCMMDVIERYKEDRAVVLTTHMMEEVEIACERVGIMVNGSFRCVGTFQELVNQTSTGFQMEISTAHLEGETKNEVKQFMIDRVPGALKTEEDSLVIAYQIPREGYPLSFVFKIGRELQETYQCETLTSQMTMDQLFLTLTQDQMADDLENGMSQSFEAKYCCFGTCCCQKGATCGCLC